MSRYIPYPCISQESQNLDVDDFLLYHYSATKFKDLRSQVAQGKIKADENPTQYGKSISFFLEPIPREIGSIWNNELDHWKKGSILNAYVVKASSLPGDIVYRLVESREKTKLIYDQQQWYEGMPQKLVEANLAAIRALEQKLGYVGEGVGSLIQLCKEQPTGLADMYKASYLRHKKYPDDKLNEKYAATVPHLIIYPGETPVDYISSTKITIK